MFDSYTTSGKLYKKIVAGFIVITVIATALFYSYLSKQNSRKTNASIGDFVTVKYTPPSTTVAVGQEYQTKIQYDLSSHAIAAQGYDLAATFDNTLLQITHITYNLGQVSSGIGDTDQTLAAVNSAGVVRLTGEIASPTPTVLGAGADIVTLTYKIKDSITVQNPNFATTVNISGTVVELKSDGSLDAISVNASGFNVQTATYTPQPSGPVAQCGRFQDIDPASPFFPYIQCLGCNGSVDGYACNVAPAGQCVPPDNLAYYVPGNNMTRGQLAKLAVQTSHVIGVIGSNTQTFADVPPGSPFYTYIENGYSHKFFTGYACGGVGEPCDAQSRAYFRPGVEVRRDQAVKIIVLAQAKTIGVPPTVATFADVPVGSTFFAEIEEAARQGIISGYDCGGTNEPCDAQRRPYFRPASSLTRGQASKLVALGLNCTMPSGSPSPVVSCVPPPDCVVKGTCEMPIDPSWCPIGNTTVSLKLRFQGITAQPKVNKKLNVQVKLVSAQIAQPIVQTVAFTADSAGLWNGVMSFNLDPTMIAQNAKFSLYVKGPMHLKKRVCELKPSEFAPGTYSCATNAISLSIGANSADLSGIYMLTGDLPVDKGVQNGLVDSADTSYIRTHFGDSSAEALNIADLNLDGSIDTQDFSLVLAALGVKYDDPEEK